MSEENPQPTQPPRRVRDRELWVGVFVLVGITAILTALFTLTDAALFRGRYIVQTQVQDAGGIRQGDPVQMRGVNIGRISSFEIGSAGVTVDLEINGQYSIPTDSKVELRSTGLLGGMVANVVPGAAAEVLGRGDTLPGSTGEGLFDQIDAMQGQTAKALNRIQRLLDEKTIDNVHESGDQFRQLLLQLNKVTAEQRREVGALTKSLRRSAEGLERTAAGPTLERAVQRIDTLLVQLETTISTLDRSMLATERILTGIDQGQGTLGKLATDDSLYHKVSAAAASIKVAADEMARLSADIRQQPKKYLDMSLF